jgi:prepilin-type N-terminal cleavage/methylation domain-containing protein
VFDKIAVMNEKGFTLIELLITIAIIGILGAIAVSSYVGSTLKAARSEAYSNLETLRLLEEEFFSLNGRYTADLGVDGDDAATRNNNVDEIQTTDGEALPGFRPGPSSNFVYWIENNKKLDPPEDSDPCFRANARGIVGSRVRGDLFQIDCFNDRNF